MSALTDATEQPAATRLRLLVRRNVLALRDWLIEAAFDARPLARLRRREHVLCIGDSHVRVMSRVRLAHAWFLPVPLDGATASGIANPQSKTSSLQRFTERLARARPWQHVLIELGEVDCGFLIWHRAKRRELSVDRQLEYTIDAYASFIERVAAMSFRSVSVMSVPLPTIGDDPESWGEVANMRKTVTVPQTERTALTLRFNAALERRCAVLGVPFVDVTTGHLDPGTGLIDGSFVRATHHDHHLADAPFAALIGRQLAERWG
jgi:hypothetical protein